MGGACQKPAPEVEDKMTPQPAPESTMPQPSRPAEAEGAKSQQPAARADAKKLVWKVLKNESDDESPLHGFIVATKTDLDLSAPSSMVDVALLVVKVVVALIQAFNNRSQFLKAIQSRVQTFTPAVEGLKAIIEGKADSVVQAPLQQLLELLCEYHRFVQKIIARAASGSFVDSVKDFLSASGDLAALDKFDTLITRALADLSMPLQVEQLQRMQEQTALLRGIGEKMQALEQKSPNAHPQVQRCLTKELAFSFWIEFYPNDYRVHGTDFRSAMKNWISDYQGLTVSGAFLDRLVAAIDEGDAENQGQSDGKDEVKEVNAFFCEMPLWTAASSADDKLQQLEGSVTHFMNLHRAKSFDAACTLLADGAGGPVEQQLYVALDCSPNSTLAPPHKPLLDEIAAWHADPGNKGHVLLVSGGAGTGKSNMLEHLMQANWAAGAAATGRRAFSVKLGSFPPDQGPRLVAYAVRQWIKNEGVAQMVEREPLLLVLDAYDEFSDRDPLKLFAAGSDVAKHPDIMVVVTCRPEYLSWSGERSLLPTNKLGNGVPTMLKQLYAVPFSKAKTQQYLEKFCAVTESTLPPAWYVQQIRQLGLDPLITGPFMLKIVATVLPSLMDGRATAARIRRLDLVRGYVQLYVERKCSDDQTVISKCVVMAVEMFQKGQLVVPQRELLQPPWPELLAGSFGNAAPTRRNASGLAFVHKALCEYFVAISIGESGGPDCLDKFCFTEADRSLLLFLADRAQAEPPFAKLLHETVLASRSSSGASPIAAANAMSVLVVSQRIFNDMDFRGIRIPGALLRGAHFYRCDFTGADLSGCDISNTVLVDTTFNDANLTSLRHPLPPLKHLESVHGIAFSPDGTQLASCSKDGTVRVWDPAAGQQLQVLKGHKRSVQRVVFSNDCKYLASCCTDGSVRVWNPAVWKKTQLLLADTKEVESAAFRSDGTESESDSSGPVAAGKLLQVLEGHTSCVNSIAFSPDGKYLASCSWDKSVRVWDPATGVQLQMLGHAAWANCVAFSNDSEHLASCSSDLTIRVWDPATGQQLQVLEGHTKEVNSIAFCSDGKLFLASSSGDKTVRLWDPATGQQLQLFEGHTADVPCVAFSNDGKRLASGSEDATVCVWDPAAVQQLQLLEGHTNGVHCLALSRDTTYLASCSSDRTVRVWDPVTGQQLQVLEGHTDHVKMVAFASDGTRLASCSKDRTVRVWDPATGQQLQVLHGHTLAVACVVFSTDGKQLASCGSDNTVRVWNPTTGQELQLLEGHTDDVICVVFSPDGTFLASCGDDKSVRVWDVSTEQQLFLLAGHTSRANHVAFGGDGTLLASCSWDKTVRVWDPATGQQLHLLEGHTDEVLCVAFSSDVRHLASCGADTTVRVWDPTSGLQLQVLRGHAERVLRIAFSRDGTRLASCSADSTVRLWDPATEQQLQVLHGHTHTVSCVAFSDDGTCLVSCSQDKSVHVHGVAGAGSSRFQKRFVLSSTLGNAMAVGCSATTERIGEASAAFVAGARCAGEDAADGGGAGERGSKRSSIEVELINPEHNPSADFWTE